jgi:hypothetical protein
VLWVPDPVPNLAVAVAVVALQPLCHLHPVAQNRTLAQ